MKDNHTSYLKVCRQGDFILRLCNRNITLTPWKEVMTNLDSILKSRDITLPAKVSLVKVMVFPVVMYRCDSWTTKKAEQ